MFWIVDLAPVRYTSEDSAREAAQAIANRERRPVMVAMGLTRLGYTELAFTVRPIR